MTSTVDAFEFSSKIPKNIKINIKSFYVFNVWNNKKNTIFVTKDDKVFGLGNNDWGRLGFGHNSDVNECTEIPELSNQKINDLIIGNTFVLGRSEEKRLFGWGENYYGQLGNELGCKSECDEYLKPQNIEYFNNEEIEVISCGYSHTMVLLTNGLLYGFGNNSCGQLGSREKDIIKPTKLEIKGNQEFKYIYCHNESSFAITFGGKLFSWGYNEYGILGQNQEKNIIQEVENSCIPREIQLSNVQKICLSNNNSYFLTDEGFVYIGGEDMRKPLMQNKINELKNICDLHSVNYEEEVICSDTENWFYYLSQNKSEKFRKYESVFEFFAKRFEITINMIHISNDGNIVNSIIQSHNISENEIFKEVKTMSALKSHFVVQYYNSWTENNSLFIQMEYCFDNLKNVLSIKPKIFERNTNEAMNSLEYFISCEIFKEITEALNYLHSLKPKPLIHRDLKPENILIGKYNNKSICKLADFGLSKFGDNNPVSHTKVGATHGYRAPEVVSGKYDALIDVYSLGIIGLEIFDLEDENLNVPELYKNSGFLEKIKKCEITIGTKLVVAMRSQRLSSQELLEVMKNWFIDLNDIKKDTKFEFYSQKFKENNLLYFNDILNVS